jgi:hypothetical protein
MTFHPALGQDFVFFSLVIVLMVVFVTVGCSPNVIFVRFGQRLEQLGGHGA